MALLEQKRERLLEDIEEDIEQIDDETFYENLQPILMNDLNNIAGLPSNRLQSRLASEAGSTCTTVTLRSGGRVYDNRPRRAEKIPLWHKYIFVITLVTLFFAIPWIVYGFSQQEEGLFWQSNGDGTAEVDEDVLEHEKKVQWDTQDIVAFCCAAVLIMIAAGGGIGGGGVLVPTYIFVLGFEPKYAIPLSNCTILGSSLSNLVLNVSKRHPKADRPLIDWDIMLMMEPLTIAGAVCGTFINVLSPPWLITIMLVILLSATAYKTLNKGIQRFREESIALEAKESAPKLTVSEGGEYKTLEDGGRIPDGASNAVSVTEAKLLEADEPDPRMIKAQREDNQTYIDILKGEQNHPAWKVLIMFLVTGGMLLCTVLKGGGDINPLNLGCHDTLYWILTLSAIPYVLIFCWIGRTHLLKVFYAKKDCGYEYLDKDVEWNETNTIRYPLLCSIAGLAAGMFGIGGGIVKGPLMLEMDVEPKVTSATSATMILFTSSGASVSYLIFQQLNLHYASVLFVLGMVFTLIGQLSLNAIVKRYNRSSLIILVIGATVFLSAIFMGIESSSSIIELVKGKAEGGGNICGAGGE